MTRSFITKKKFYDIRRAVKLGRRFGLSQTTVCKGANLSPTTITKILQARNFREYKASGQVYGKGVKSLRKRYLFILGVIAVVLLILNLR